MKILKKVAQCEKKSKGGDLFVSSGIVCYAGILFGSVPWANRYNLASSQNFVELLVELFWSLQVVLKNTDLRKAPTNKKGCFRYFFVYRGIISFYLVHQIQLECVILRFE